MSNGELFEQYVQRFAKSKGLDPEKVKEVRIVREYKDWIERECKDDHRGQEKLSQEIQEIDTEDKSC